MFKALLFYLFAYLLIMCIFCAPITFTTAQFILCLSVPLSLSTWLAFIWIPGSYGFVLFISLLLSPLAEVSG